MALFGKKSSQRPETFVQNDLPPLPEPPIPPVGDQLRKVLENQAILAQNQQLILNGIGSTQALIKSLATSEEPEDDLSEEELEAAIKEARAKKKGGK